MPSLHSCIAAVGHHWHVTPTQQALNVHRMVHDDVYKIIKYTVQKTMTGELAQRALDWWAGLVEHLFGLPERTPEQEKAVVPAAEDHSTRNKVNPWSDPSLQIRWLPDELPLDCKHLTLPIYTALTWGGATAAS